MEPPCTPTRLPCSPDERPNLYCVVHFVDGSTLNLDGSADENYRLFTQAAGGHSWAYIKTHEQTVAINTACITYLQERDADLVPMAVVP